MIFKYKIKHPELADVLHLLREAMEGMAAHPGDLLERVKWAYLDGRLGTLGLFKLPDELRAEWKAIEADCLARGPYNSDSGSFVAGVNAMRPKDLRAVVIRLQGLRAHIQEQLEAEEAHAFDEMYGSTDKRKRPRKVKQ